MTKIKFKKLHDGAKLPTRATDGSAGLDLYWDGSGVINRADAKDVLRLCTGIAAEIPPGYVGIIKERSGLGSKGVQVRGGVIDSDFRGEIVVLLQGGIATLEPGDKAAQLVVVPCLTAFEEVEELMATDRGGKGFGSSGN